MLKKIIIENYRCYLKHEIDFKRLSIIVGKNNAGKSTLVEALRLIAIALNRFKTSGYYNPPKWLELPKRTMGIIIKNIFFDFNNQNISHLYSDGSSKILAIFSDRIIVSVHIENKGNFLEVGPEFFCTLQDSSGQYITGKNFATNLNLPKINILPQISVLQKEEKQLASEEYIKQNLATNLLSLHFRNQLSILPESFQDFKDITELSWPGLQIRELELGSSKNKKGERLYTLMVREGNFVTEIGVMGHGLQMWLQIMWFLSRIKEDEIVILDEPDVYMHPDLQRKLMRILQNRFKQVVVSTHSVEIISEVEAESILIIDKNNEKSIFASKITVVQDILNSIGSIHNLQLTKIWSSKKMLLVEGKDVAILKRLHNKCFPNSEEPFDTIPNFNLNGWGGWNYAIGSNRLLKETIDPKIIVYCLFDSDYHTPEEISERYISAKQYNVEMHIWEKKEIENYLVVPKTILRTIRFETNDQISNIDEIQNEISRIIKSIEEDTLLSLGSEIQKKQRIDLKKAYRIAKELYINLEDRISGKELISQLNEWSQAKYHVSLSPLKLAQNMLKSEISEEVERVIKAIETNKPIMFNS